jgi:hypothetical protein
MRAAPMRLGFDRSGHRHQEGAGRERNDKFSHDVPVSRGRRFRHGAIITNALPSMQNGTAPTTALCRCNIGYAREACKCGHVLSPPRTNVADTSSNNNGNVDFTFLI